MLRNWPIILLAAVLVVIIGVSCYTDPSYQDKQNGAGNSSPTTGVTQTEAGHSSQETQTTKHPPRGWRKLFVWPEGVTALAVLATLFFIGWQAWLTRQAIASADNATKTELRAYLAVVVGSAAFQERLEPARRDLKFEARPLLLNTGRTPASRIRFKARSAILPVPLPDGIDLPVTYDKDPGEGVLGTNQNAQMFATLDGFCQDSEVETIKKGEGSALYVWGLVTYDDVFGDTHETLFCQQIYWVGQVIHGYYIPNRNHAA
jgi:hypothetical protein